MALYEFWTSRNNSVANTAAYVGQIGRLFYDNTDGILKISDGTTPGGIRITYPVASTTQIGGIKAGPGANISATGTLTIDTTGLPLSFGDFTANVNMLSMVNENQNMILDTQGDAEIQLVGNIGFYRSNGGSAPEAEDLYFKAQEDGQIFIYVPNADSLAAGVDIIGSISGSTIAPGIEGALLHLTGQPDLPCRTYFDGNGDYVSWVARRWNGNVAVPTQVLANQDVLRINATAATTSGVGNVAMAQVSLTALENQTPTAQGSKITFTVTPIGSAASARVNVANVTVADGVWATKFTGNLTGTASTATNLTAATGILVGTLSVNPPNTGKNASVVGTYTITGLTTSHKIVLMPQAALPDNFNIAGAWASDTNTVSINFQTYAGGIDAPAVTVAYWAWV